MDPYEPVAAALRRYLRALHAAWSHPSFSYAPASTAPSQYDKVIVTRATSGSPTRLPLTGRLVRGGEGVSIEEVNPPEPVRPAVRDLIMHASAKWRYHPPLTEEESAVPQAAREAESAVLRAMSTIPSLREMAYGSTGFKDRDLQEIREHIAQELAHAEETISSLRFGLMTTLWRTLDRAFERSNFDPALPASFDAWDQVVDLTLESLVRLAGRETWSYEVVALLNAPLIDSLEPVEIVEATLRGQRVVVSMEAVSDDLLTRIHHRSYNLTGFGPRVATAPINSAITYRVEVSVDAPQSDFIGVLEDAADLFSRIVDVLRLVRSDDLGIIGVESFPGDDAGPTIRHHYDVSHNPIYSSVTPRRSFFFLESTDPLSAEALDTLRRALPSYLDGAHGVPGLDVSVKRYRDSRERYRPGDPESLLDLAFALEALLLNDAASGQGELGYRLALRAALLVGGPIDIRKEVFSGVRDLYTVRSKLAHGQTLDSMKERDARRVREALNLAPDLLRFILLRFLMGEGPAGLDGKELAGWWRELELGGKSPLLRHDEESDPDGEPDAPITSGSS